MPRGPRSTPGGVIFHALNRGNNRSALFTTASDYLAFTTVVKESLLIVPIRVLAYCLMPNHWHFVLWPETDDQLSDFMHQMETTHVRRWHGFRHTEGSGHLYQGPFKSFPVEDDDHFWTVCRYVERNARRANLVDRVEAWVWGSAWARQRREHPAALPISQWPVQMPEDWLEWVNQPLTDAEVNAVRQSVRRGRPYGCDPWTRRTAEQLGLQQTFRSRGRPCRSTCRSR